ncbi:glycerophosphodiester phosphodiesterase [Staphylococcus felis]|uniref:glycerophosphodiester phosphodiesterase n=1 Tax=Staphylococcus felis TaxID=46127 RepID=UPI000E289618|nr:glycerophosphodiester phosphodiesterase family protein [Staphylococcus felis]REH80536.1 glycerophosphodiester phosphodiesterase [Staphylococcus felis]REH93538.1 glycerophosphodiester phosphodiesterase [Staphylococcus felis]REH95268.1 glycerophosphodiester phosphodiesterase [Staphylococcus felis]REI00005.1 glycerophosphodiester phosphodiesterase [Staphylococcus felis]REI04918.1 glycerophosphodiester phosphodiesterase [Staphylococcus felis]
MKIMKPQPEFNIIAHRGLSQRFPENTKSAFIAALSQHIDMLEIDIHRTKDGELVVIHDETVDRTSNHKGAIKDLTLKELKRYDFGGWKSKGDYESILTFKEVIELAKNYSKCLLIEIKKPANYPNIESDVLKVIEDCAFPISRIIIQSFDQLSIQRFRSLHPTLKLGVLLSKRKYWFKQPPFEKIAQYAQYINPEYSMVNRHFMERAKLYQLEVFPYTVNTSKDVKKLIQLGVNGVISDVPDELFRL